MSTSEEKLRIFVKVGTEKLTLPLPGSMNFAEERDSLQQRARKRATFDKIEIVELKLKSDLLHDDYTAGDDDENEESNDAEIPSVSQPFNIAEGIFFAPNDVGQPRHRSEGEELGELGAATRSHLSLRRERTNEMTAPTPAPAATVDEIKRMLLSTPVTAATIDDLVRGIVNLFVDDSAVGGVYCVRLKSAHVRVDATGEELVLIKMGRADNYSNRFSQFGFDYDVIFRVNGDNGMEKWLKKALKPNCAKTFWQRAKVPSVKTYLHFSKSNNPAPTEWRIVSRSFFDSLVKLAPTLTNLNYQTEIDRVVRSSLLKLTEAGAVSFSFSANPQHKPTMYKNKVRFEYV